MAIGVLSILILQTSFSRNQKNPHNSGGEGGPPLMDDTGRAR